MDGRSLVLWVALLVWPGVGWGQGVGAEVGRVADRELDRIVGATGAVIAVVGEDGGVRVEAFGSITGESSEPMRADLLFGTAGFDAVLMGLVGAVLHARGQIDLYAPVRTFITDLPPRLGQVTLAQLLSHTAGLDDAETEAPLRRPVSRTWPEATDRALFTEPGAIHSPSRYGARLARTVIEHHTGARISELVERLVLSPLGMDRSTFDGDRADRLGAAPGHVVSTSIDRPLVALAPGQNPHPHFFTSAADLARLVAALLRAGNSDGRQPLPDGAVDEVIRPRAARPAVPGDSVAMGWAVTRFRGTRQLVYAGGTAGYGVVVRLLPDAGAAVIALANGTSAMLNTTADSALAGVLRARTVTEAEARAMPAPSAADGVPADVPEDPGAFVGSWGNGDRVIVLAMREGQLTWVDGDMVLSVRRDGPLFHVLVADGRVARTFRWTRDDDGRSYLVVDERAFVKLAASGHRPQSPPRPPRAPR